ncbi:DUF2764 domain-containing protein [Treponema sp. OttesenSCG-928-L16]|nr:DUF2764 domain-containing protein [Treponema sp. OttesenSCG-928-L16]
MGSYYYLIAQLPYLMYGQSAPMTSDSFKSLARDMISPADAALLDLCSLDPEPLEAEDPVQAGEKAGPSYAELPSGTSSAFIDAWRNWERALRLNLARYRAGKLKRENGAPVDPPESPLDAAAIAKAALAMDSPLEAELYLDEARWEAVDAMQGFDYFGRNTVYAYLLKLLLMERRSLFKTEEGFSEYKILYASIMEAAGGTGAGGLGAGGPWSETSIESGEPK